MKFLTLAASAAIAAFLALPVFAGEAEAPKSDAAKTADAAKPADAAKTGGTCDKAKCGEGKCDKSKCGEGACDKAKCGDGACATKTQSPIHSMMGWLAKQVAPSVECPCPAKADAEAAWRGWFAGGKDVPAAALRDALVADGWTADRFVGFFQAQAKAKAAEAASSEGGKCCDEGKCADGKCGEKCGEKCGDGKCCGKCKKGEVAKTETPAAKPEQPAEAPAKP